MRAKSPILLVLLLAACTTGGQAGGLAGGDVLYRGPGDEPVVVTEKAGVRALRFGEDGATQSAMWPGRPDRLALDYTRAQMAGLAFVPAPRSVLLVGLGGGTMATYLHQLYPEARIDAVEIDAEVLTVAERFFEFPVDDPRVHANVEDGRRFLERTERQWDLILLDAYSSTQIPRHLTTVEFLELVRARLAPGGVVSANLWDDPANPHFPAMLRSYQEVFGEVWKLPAGGNAIVLAAEGPAHDRLALIETARDLGAERLGFDLASMLERRLERIEAPVEAEPIVDDPWKKAAGAA